MQPDVSPNSGSAEAGTARQAIGTALLVIAVATALRLVVAALLPAGEDEAYAIGIARQFSLSYFDHPPLHFWIVGGWARLINSENLLLLRLPFVAMAALSSWFMFALTRRLFGPAAAVWAVVLFNIAPVYGIAHGTLVLPDGPLLCASLAMAVVLARIVFEDDGSPQFGRWMLVGLLAGLAMLSKYHGLLLVGGVFLFLLTKPYRRWLSWPGPWMAALIALIMFTPVLLWNARHGWVSFAFQAGRGDGDGLHWANLLQSLGAQSAYLVPWIFVAVAVALLRALLAGPKRMKSWMLACLGVLPIVIFTGLTLRSPGLPHWPMPGWVFILPLLAEWLAGLKPFGRTAGKAIALVTAVVAVGFAGVTIAQARWGVLRLDNDPTAMLQPWDSLETQLAARGLPANGKTFIAARNWRRAGELNFLLGRDVPVLCLCGDARHFAYEQQLTEYAGWTGILIDTPGSLSDAAVAPMFEGVSPAEDVGLSKAGQVVVPLSLRLGTGFKP
jgi:4-amino-4-deoxy-L-arabinose transferase-like glycosyltransferase